MRLCFFVKQNYVLLYPKPAIIAIIPDKKNHTIICRQYYFSDMPYITVIIPTYNRAYCLPTAIDSVLTQTEPDFELIVVDDGSTDNTAEIVKNYSDPRLTCVQTPNRGVSAARNRGLQKGTGEYYCFLDSDDYWLQEKLKRQKEFHEYNPGILISQTNEIWMRKSRDNRSGRPAGSPSAHHDAGPGPLRIPPAYRRVNQMKKHYKKAGDIYRHCLPLCLITPSSVMIHRTVFKDVGAFDEDLPACEDYDLWLRITCTYEVGLVREALIVKFGGHADQLSYNIPCLDKYRIQAMLKVLNSGTLTKDQKRATLRELIKKCAIYANGCLKHSKEEEGTHYQKLALEMKQKLAADSF